MSEPTPSGYVDYIRKPSNGNYYKIRDKEAREQLVLKTEKMYLDDISTLQGYINGLNNGTITDQTVPSKTTLLKQVFYVPETDNQGQPTGSGIYDEWTILWTVSGQMPNQVITYRGVRLGSTAVDVRNFSTKGHTHNVTPETEVDDHNYTPKGAVDVEIGYDDTLTVDDTQSNHQHHYTPAGSIVTDPDSENGIPDSGTTKAFTGTHDDTDSVQGHSHGVTPTEKYLKRRKVKVETASVSLGNNTQMENVNKSGFKKDANNQYIGTYDADCSVLNDFDVDDDGVLEFKDRQYDTEDVYKSLQLQTDANKTSIEDANQTQQYSGIDIDFVNELGNSGNTNDKVLAGVSVDSGGGHNHGYTPSGKIRVKFSGSRGATESGEGAHQHKYKKAKKNSASFQGAPAKIKHKVRNHTVSTGADSYDPSGNFLNWYGVSIDESQTDPQAVTRIGNMGMHVDLPIQSLMRRCLVKPDGTIYNYLDPFDSRYYAQGSRDTAGNDISGLAAELGGTVHSVHGDGTSQTFIANVMVEIPKHWRKTTKVGNVLTVKVSPYQQDGWYETPDDFFVSAFDGIITDGKLYSKSTIAWKDITGTATDAILSHDATTGTPVVTIAQSNGARATHSTTQADFLAAARALTASGSNTYYNNASYLYEAHIALWWLYIIEHANRNSQADFKSQKTVQGFTQGGLGASCTTGWNGFGSYSPCVCGITSVLGNQTGELIIKNSSNNATVCRVSSYRGVENVFGDVWKGVCDAKCSDNVLYRARDPQYYGLGQSLDNFFAAANIDTTSASGQYISKIAGVSDNADQEKQVWFDGDIMPKARSGTATTCYCDYNWYASGWRAVFLGGAAFNDAIAGFVASFTSDELTVTYTYFGSRLCFIKR